VVRPVATYACEIWVLIESEISKLLVFERNIRRKIFGPSKENDSWLVNENKSIIESVNQL
jgi:hypothetical protein